MFFDVACLISVFIFGMFLGIKIGHDMGWDARSKNRLAR